MRILRLATRSSEQAHRQSQAFADRVTEVTGHPVALVFVETLGDKVRDRPLAELGGRGIFVKEVQHAVLHGLADLAVHSAKDLPSSFHAEGLVLACVPERGDARDALVGGTLVSLPKGAVVATGSQRRQAQLARMRPDLRFVGLRGNIPTRVAKADDPNIDATVVAVTGVRWVGLEHRLAQTFSVEEMVPQIGQGAMAVECREDDESTRSLLRRLEHGPTRRAVDAERAFLATLGGGCELPVGAHATMTPTGQITITGLIASVDGRHVFRDTATGNDSSIGRELAESLLAAGGSELLT